MTLRTAAYRGIDMECKGKLKDVSRDYMSDKWRVTFETDENITAAIDDIKDKDLSITAKIYRQKRSLDSNAYAWVLMQKIADVCMTDKWTIYLRSLERYSRAYTFVIVRPEVVDKFTAEWRTVINHGPVKVNGQTGIQLQCFFGSSTFDTKEMSVFIDGLVSECKDLGIETLPPDELERMKQEWGV